MDMSVRADVYFVEAEKFESLYNKVVGMFISWRLSCFTLNTK